MSSAPEVLFCDLCNESVPLGDLESGRALRIKDRVIGACCAPELRRPAERVVERRAGGTAGVAVAAVVLLAALAATAAFLDWRFSEEVSAIGRRIDGIDDGFRRGQDRLAAVEEAIAQLGRRVDMDLVSARFDGIDARIDGARASSDQRSARIEEALAAITDEERRARQAQQEAIDAVRQSVAELSIAVAELRAAPRPAPSRSEPAPSDAGPAEAVPEAAAAPADELPAELKHHVMALADEDPGTRFTAVDKLLRSRDPRVLGALLPMAKDSNLFVRRLTVAGLRDFRSPESIEALLVALADPEALVRLAANAALRELTGQRIEFDDATASSRAAGQRRWQEWWDKNRATFTF